jgi:rhomboid protease GluP
VRTRVPILTIAFLGAAAVVTALRDVVPGIVPALSRDPDRLRAGELWRLVSPVFVQPDPPLVCLLVFAMVAVVGVVAERHFGHWRWLVLYLTGALVGHGIGELWQPGSAGVSVAGCGLLGGIVAWLLRSGPLRRQVWAFARLVFAVVDTALRDIHGLPIMAGAVVGALILRGVPPAGEAPSRARVCSAPLR